ncbi:MAG: endonuclease/exonuclease/phosphatase family protein [Candidatus Hydrogenedentes bacterium]|nr:endonuclease/exonuclease/phosphatase family protein [Candidatus Hydrogenedentota bacterium]
MNRRAFLVTSAAASAFLGAPLRAPAQPAGGFTTISYNVLACRGYPYLDTDTERGARAAAQMADRVAMELALYSPDIVTFQESPAEAVAEQIANALGLSHAWFPGGFPGTIISRFPISNSVNHSKTDDSHPADLFTRHFCQASLRHPDGEITLFSAHLHPSDAAVREREVTAILEAMKPALDAGGPVLFQGDLNHAPDGPEYARWEAAGLVDAATRASDAPGMTIRSDKPSRRIDYIWAGGALASRIRDCRVLFEGAFRTNPDDPGSFALSDHLPVLARFAD